MSFIGHERFEVLDYLKRSIRGMREIAQNNPSVGSRLLSIAEQLDIATANLEAKLIEAGYIPLRPANQEDPATHRGNETLSLSLPTSAVRPANGAVLDEGGAPLNDYWTFNEAGDPIPLKNAALPPDVLDRIRSKLGENVGVAGQQGQSAATTAKKLADRFDTFLQNEHPATVSYPGYATIRDEFKANSRPLDPLSTGAPAQVLENNRPYGSAPQYTMPPERVPDLFLRGPAVKNQPRPSRGGLWRKGRLLNILPMSQRRRLTW
jgi:hypothetical protein